MKKTVAVLCLALAFLQVNDRCAAAAEQPSPGDPIEAAFEEARTAGDAGDWHKAELIYRRILDEHPDLPRVRLELARALYEEGDDIAAEYNFRLALAGDLPEVVTQHVAQFLNQIRERKRLSLDVALGSLIDSNVNRGTAASEITLFGLPFVLSQEARQKSGFGASVSIAGEYALPVRPDLRLRSGAAFYRIDYAGGQFDDMQAKAYVGPQIVHADSDFSVLGVAVKRWFGNAGYYQGAGARIEAGWNASPRYRIEGSVEAAKLHFPARDFLDGYQIDATTTQSYALTAASFVRLILGGGYQETRDATWQNEYARIGIGYGRDLPWGVSVYVEPGAARFWYDDPYFGQERRDTLVSATVTLTKRDWRILGLAPTITFGYQKDISTVDVLTFDRKVFQIGFTRHF